MAKHAIPRETPEQSADDVRHERKDANFVGVLIAIALLTLSIAVVYIASWGTLDALCTTASDQYLKVPARSHLPPEPRLEGIDALEAAQYPDTGLEAWRTRHDAEQLQLTTYGWTDQQKHLVHIPIRSAMQMAVDKQLFPAESIDNKTPPSIPRTTP